MNTFGNLFRAATWGESHGKAIGAVIDGCPAGLRITEHEITNFLKKTDRPIEALATERAEANTVQILSGTVNDITIGTPISLIIENSNYKETDYSNIKKCFRPGHGDFTYFAKFGLEPLSGGGRASGRECISRLSTGYIAEKVIKRILPEYRLFSHITSLAGVKITDELSRRNAVERVIQISMENDSSGGEVTVTVTGLPAGIGSPVFSSLDADLAGAVMGIGGVKAVEIGIGKNCATLRGSECNDDFEVNGNNISFTSNNAGGVLSGISNGDELIIHFTIKPTPSIEKKQNGLTIDNELKEISTTGRHDKNITPRAAKIAEAMINCVLLDHLMICGKINRDRINGDRIE